jgi:hypothetical protein
MLSFVIVLAYIGVRHRPLTITTFKIAYALQVKDMNRCVKRKNIILANFVDLCLH